MLKRIDRYYLYFALVVAIAGFAVGCWYALTHMGQVDEWVYLLLIPIGWSTSILDTNRAIKTKTASGRSILAYGLALGLLLNGLARVVIVGDFFLVLNTVTIFLLNIYQFAIFVVYRK